MSDAYNVDVNWAAVGSLFERRALFFTSVGRSMTVLKTEGRFVVNVDINVFTLQPCLFVAWFTYSGSMN